MNSVSYLGQPLIFFNTDGNINAQDTRTWTFDGEILGVMEDDDGAAMATTDSMFANGSYFGGDSGFNNQGLEIGLHGGYDNFTILSMMELEVSMHVLEPGDWIRVLTLSSVSAVPVPAALFMFAPALLGFLGLRRKTKTAIA